MKRRIFLAFVFVSTSSLPARAEFSQTIDSARIRLSDVSDGYEDGDLASLDLGPAPPPGNTRLLSRVEVEEQLRAAGDDGKHLRMPAALRVKSAARRWTPDELREAFAPKLMRALPAGVEFKSSRLTRSLVTSPRAHVGEAHLPRIPKHTGELTLTASVDLVQDDVTVLRVPVTLTVQVSEAATMPAAAKGSRVNLIIEHGAARVSALAMAMSDIELGATGLFRVASTQRVLRARLLSPDSAQVVE